MRLSELKILLVPVAAFLFLLAAYVGTGRLEGQTVSLWAGPVSVDSPTELTAGEAVVVSITAPAADGTRAQLGLFAPVNNLVLESFLINRTAEFVVPVEATQHAGVLRLVAQVGASQSETIIISVSPLASVDPVVPLVGPRTIIADGADNTMAVVSPTDPFGNPVIAGTEVSIELLRPDGTRETVTEPVERGLVASIIGSTTEAGRVVVSATTSTAEGPGNVVDQVAGIPALFTVEVDARNALADGFTLHEVQTSTLRDQFGNILPDGLSAVFVVEDASGSSLVQSVVQGGIARTVIEAPNQPGELSVRARVSGAESTPLALFFDQAVDQVPAVVVATDNELVITVGPVLTARGGYVPDGTEVSIQHAITGETIATGAFRTGVSEITMQGAALGATNFDLATNQLTAVVLGTTADVTTGDS